MRLTLRTMLAYMDDVLDPADSAELRQKIDESDFASGLVDRIRGVLKKLRIDAPKVDGKGMGSDANTVSEYLDGALEQDRVAEFERVCLESDKHLCDVAACHQILTIVLGKPADVPAELRERIYALGDPERAVVRLAGSAGTKADPAKHPTAAHANGRPARTRPLEVPEYLRDSRQQSLWPLVGLMAAAVLLTVGVLRAIHPFDAEHPVARWFQGGRTIAQVAEQPETENTEAEGTAPAPTGPNAAANTAAANTAAANTAGDAATSSTEPAPEAGGKAPAVVSTDAQPTTTPAAPAETTIAAAPAPVVTAPIPSDPTEPTSPVPVPTTTTPAGVTGVIPMIPRAKPPEPPKAKPLEVGRYTSDAQLLATLDPDDGLWYVKQSQEILSAGERMVVLPPYRAQLALPSAVTLTFVGEGSVRMEEPDAANIPQAVIDYGRFLVATAGKAGAQVHLNLAGTKGLLTLVEADSAMAIKVARWVPPGADPQVAENGSIVIEMYNRNGKTIWQPVGQDTNVEIPARFVYVHFADLPPEMHGPYFQPDWVEEKSIKPIDADAASKLEKMIELEKPFVLSLQEAMKDRRVEVRSLAARGLVALGEFEPALRELNDPNQYSFWQSEFDALRHALARSPETATKIHETINLTRSADAADLYRLLWSYSEEQLAKGAAAQLVKYLDHEQLDVRVLSYVNLVSITGVFGTYRPERPAPQRKTPVADWAKRRDKGAIIYKGPPSPLDTYKPVAAASDIKTGASAVPK